MTARRSGSRKVEPISDAGVERMRAKARRTAAHQTMVCVPILDLAGLIARADAAEAERDAALARVSALIEGLGVPDGYLPDLPTPTAAQEDTAHDRA